LLFDATIARIPQKRGPALRVPSWLPPVQAGGKLWVSAFAGMTEKGAGTDVEFTPLASMMRFDLDDNMASRQVGPHA